MAEEIITSTNADTVTDHEYNASEIQVLKGLEAVRKRPGMYIGSTGERGRHHLVSEIVDNAIDEALAGYCDHIEVKILKDNIIQVTDNGRGIPVDIQADTGLPAVTVVYTILHAGGKFGGENSGYKVAGGLHGVGASVVNACSEWLTVNVRRDGKEYEQTFRRGDPDGDLKCIGTVAEGVTGTRVTFKPDPEMFKDTTVYDFDTLEKRLREESFLNAGVKITLTDERQLYTPVLEDGQEGDPCYRSEVMCYEGGIKSFVTYLGEKRKLEVLHPNVIYLKGQTDRGVAEIALQYNSSYNELLLSFANNVNTPDGGTHEEGFKASLTRVFNDYGRSHGLLKDKDENLSGADVREGLICVISVKLQEAEFEGQTKAKLGNTEIRTLVSNMVYSKLMEFFEENPGVAKAIFEKATQAARARAAAKKARELVRRKSALETSRMPGKLADCREKDPSRTEIFIVDGLQEALTTICKQAEESVAEGVNYIILTDRDVNATHAAIPSLLAVSAVHHHLISVGKRVQTALVVESGEIREVMHAALLLGFGASALNPYMAFAILNKLVARKEIQLDYATAEKNYIKAICKGLFKVMSKMGISTIRSYRGAKIFEAIGLSEELSNAYFGGLPSRIGGIRLEEIARDAVFSVESGKLKVESSMQQEDVANSQNSSQPNNFQLSTLNFQLNNRGLYSFRKDGEKHAWNPETISTLQLATRLGSYKKFKEFTSMVDNKEAPIFLRDFFAFKRNPINIDRVEPIENIMRRFVTGAMSYGSISREAHEAMAIAMNKIHGRSNTGEGGEDAARFIPRADGTSLRSAIKQVASGRFGVTTEYLVNADIPK